jgi:hypothetical protein
MGVHRGRRADAYHATREDPSMRSNLGSWILFAAVAAVAAPAHAEEALPPERPTTPYHAKVRNSYSIERPGGGSSGGDTLDIRVSGTRLYEDAQIIEEKTFLVDTAKREVIEFVADAEEKVATRMELNDTPIPYVDGRVALAAYDPSWGPPKVAGSDKVAKQKCTILHFGKPEEDGIAACVSKEGVVMRAKIVWPGYEREFEVLDFDAGKQDDKWFRPPAGFTIVEG